MFRKKQYSLFAVLIALILFISACSVNENGSDSSVTSAASKTTGTRSDVTSTSQSKENGETDQSSEVTADSTTSGTLPETDLPPVEDLPPEADFEPAFAGQTRANGMATSTDLDIEIISDALSSPWAVKKLPDGRLAITEKRGTLRLATADGELSDPITGFPPVNDKGQGGLLDVEPAPDFESSRMLYFSLAEVYFSNSVTAVGRGRLADDESEIENFEIIYRAEPWLDNNLHYGSRVIFDEKSNLFISTGERSDSKVRHFAQDLSSGYGKIIHITPDGDPVPGSPFVEGAHWPEVYSYGHRNVQGMDIHPVTGDLWISEMGPRGGDELNLILPGRNYGWPLVSYGIEYSGASVGSGEAHMAGMEEPVYYWDPVIAPSGMSFYDSDVIPEWQNNLFIGALRGQHIARLLIVDQRVVGEERLLADEGQRFRDVEEMDGALYAVTDSGWLYRIRKA